MNHFKKLSLCVAIILSASAGLSASGHKLKRAEEMPRYGQPSPELQLINLRQDVLRLQATLHKLQKSNTQHLKYIATLEAENATLKKDNEAAIKILEGGVNRKLQKIQQSNQTPSNN